MKGHFEPWDEVFLHFFEGRAGHFHFQAFFLMMRIQIDEKRKNSKSKIQMGSRDW
jgi:hypothetical protein